MPPKATTGWQIAICRDGPETDIVVSLSRASGAVDAKERSQIPFCHHSGVAQAAPFQVLGFHSCASFCALVICACVMFAAQESRALIALSRLSFFEAGNCEAARLNHIYART